jgi:iron(II)-dependent oxidoreductase
MQTSGFAGEGIARLYEGDRLARALAETRTRTLALYAHLDLTALRVPFMATINPPVWELGHIAWFQEHWCLRYSAPGAGVSRGSILPGSDALFDSRTVPHGSRWHLPIPVPRLVFGYMKESLEATLEALANTPAEQRYFFALSLLHEDMHGEALLMTLQTLGLPPPPIASQIPASQAAPVLRDVPFEGGEFQQGSRRDATSFVFDNEKWSHGRSVSPFRIASRTVTQGEFALFVDDGGYERESLWTHEGWNWLRQAARREPLYWRREEGAWRVRRFDAWMALDPEAPMLHVSLHEAAAYCRWAGRRLPTETEWEFAACNGGSANRYPWGDEEPIASSALDFRRRGPQSGEGKSTAGLYDLIGSVWEWTASPFIPYPGFAPDPYREYSEPWFESHYVLRGGSFATRSRLVHNRFRNFYLPERADAFNGIRTCAVEPT